MRITNATVFVLFGLGERKYKRDAAYIARRWFMRVSIVTLIIIIIIVAVCREMQDSALGQKAIALHYIYAHHVQTYHISDTIRHSQ